MLIDELNELESNHEINVIELLSIARRQANLIKKFQSLVNVDAGEAIDTLIELQYE